eukprot:Seg2781.4 transcript_id=Seg2781.4/GoldUCD/mRNA.D3Y31 product="Protein boule" protein_id=Seg2781.4/GoldUCD/D3Y31
MTAQNTGTSSNFGLVNSTIALHFPHRIFVGSLTRETTPAEIAEFFRTFGVVIETKIILDSSGCSRGFGFVSFDSKEAVANVLRQGTIYLKGRKITVAPAVKKHNIQDRLPTNVKPTKYFTKKGTVQQISNASEVMKQHAATFQNEQPSMQATIHQSQNIQPTANIQPAPTVHQNIHPNMQQPQYQFPIGAYYRNPYGMCVYFQ